MLQSHPFPVWLDKGCSTSCGDVLILSNGEYVVVEFIQHEILESPVKVYNFEVDDFHTYFVGESSVLVHNNCTYSVDPSMYEGDEAAGVLTAIPL